MSSQKMVFARPPSPNALPDEPADYFRPAIPEPGDPANEIPFHSSSADGDQPPEYFRPFDTDPLQTEIPYHVSDVDENQPDNYFRPFDTEPLQTTIPFNAFPHGDQPAEYFRPFSPIPEQAEIFPWPQLSGEVDMSDLFNFGYLSTHSTEENLGLNRLLQPLGEDTQIVDFAYDEPQQIMDLGYHEPQQVDENDIDARLVAALTSVNGEYAGDMENGCPNRSGGN